MSRFLDEGARLPVKRPHDIAAAADAVFEATPRSRRGREFWELIEASDIAEIVLRLIDGTEWSADTLQEIAQCFTSRGYRVRDCEVAK